MYDGSTTLDIGLTGVEHTRADGSKSSSALHLNAAGQVIGYADRYNGGSTQLGISAWFYDDDLDFTFEAPELSLRSDGYAYSNLTYLDDAGLALGYYNLYDGMSLVGERALMFTLSGGWQDLGMAVDGGLDANGWSYLARAVSANGAGQIIGSGLTTSQSSGQFAYLLTPSSAAVPEPGTWLLFCAGLLVMFGRHHFKPRS